MKRARGMQKLKRRFSGADLPMPHLESGTYPIAHDKDEGEVTLVVFGWHNVQPGTLSWVFPSLDAAVRAARALRNATQWVIMGGNDATGGILAECGT